MDTHTGRLYDDKELAALKAELRNAGIIPEPDRFRKVRPTKRQMSRHPPRVGRNDLCPCGSGEKFKRCCMKEGARL